MATETSSRAKPSGILTLLWALFFFFVFALLITFWVKMQRHRDCRSR
jgi:hypothetical protein